jgi:hypothetical protein
MTVGDSKKAPSELLAQLRVVYESGYVRAPEINRLTILALVT